MALRCRGHFYYDLSAFLILFLSFAPPFQGTAPSSFQQIGSGAMAIDPAPHQPTNQPTKQTNKQQSSLWKLILLAAVIGPRMYM